MRWGLAIRGAALGAAVALGLASAGGAAARPDEPKPEPKPTPKLELLTETQDEALRKKAIKVEVSSRRGDEVRAQATLVVDGFPDDYTFRLGPESQPLRERQAQAPLSAQRPQARSARLRRPGL